MKLVTSNDPYEVIAETVNSDPRYAQGGTDRRQLEAQIDSVNLDRDYDPLDNGTGHWNE